MKSRYLPMSIMLLTLMVFQDTASANAGTALMMGGALHLIIGNLFIGIFEGLVIGFIFRQTKIRSIGLMVVGNYFSAWTTIFIINLSRPSIEGITIYQLNSFIIAALITAFVYTVFTEWLFVHFSFHKAKRKACLTLSASLAIHLVSYAGLVYYYNDISATGIYRNAEIASASDVIENVKVDIYYIKNGTGNIYKLSLPENSEDVFYSCGNDEKIHSLYIQPSGADKASFYDLYAGIEKTSANENEKRLIQSQILFHDNIDPLSSGRDHEFSVFDYNPIDYRSSDKQWSIYAGVWANAGLIFYNNDTKEKFYVSLETPFMSWYVYNPTILAGDNVIFEWGNQICIYSRSTRKLALLARGTYPIVILNHEEDN